jgi:hypothetical protein
MGFLFFIEIPDFDKTRVLFKIRVLWLLGSTAAVAGFDVVWVRVVSLLGSLAMH